MNFHKYHGLGNDYIVLDPADFVDWSGPSVSHIRTICHRNFGVGSDGILWGPLKSDRADFGLRIFNPDGSEAEKSGNGLRIFARYLWDQKRVTTDPFQIETIGGTVRAAILPNGCSITVDMGRVSFQSTEIPVSGDRREVINESICALDRTFSYCAATIGNPHCVILETVVSPKLAQTYGSVLEVHPLFPNKTNVQFMQVIDRGRIRIEIWERGAGYTLASGSSSSAAAAVAHRLGLVDADVTVEMPGGEIQIKLSTNFEVTMTGNVTPIACGTLSPEMFSVVV